MIDRNNLKKDLDDIVAKFIVVRISYLKREGKEGREVSKKAQQEYFSKQRGKKRKIDNLQMNL